MRFDYMVGQSLSHGYADTAYAAEPFCRCATSPHTVGSHPSRGAYGVSGDAAPYVQEERLHTHINAKRADASIGPYG